MARDKKKLNHKRVIDRYIFYRSRYSVRRSIEWTADDFETTVEEVRRVLGLDS